MHRKKRVLLVEDGRPWRRAMEQMIERRGAEVTSTDNLKDAIKLVKEGSYDLYVTDGHFPLAKNGPCDARAGLRLCRILKRKDPTAQIVLWTGEYKQERDARQLGVDFIGKGDDGPIERYLEQQLTDKAPLPKKNPKPPLISRISRYLASWWR